MSESKTSSPQSENQEKRVWQTPSIEELDLHATEAGYVYGVPVDAGIYTL